jgi:hypothetical protein
MAVIVIRVIFSRRVELLRHLRQTSVSFSLSFVSFVVEILSAVMDPSFFYIVEISGCEPTDLD